MQINIVMRRHHNHPAAGAMLRHQRFHQGNALFVQ
jgi:hypothetical protein